MRARMFKTVRDTVQRSRRAELTYREPKAPEPETATLLPFVEPSSIQFSASEEAHQAAA